VFTSGVSMIRQSDASPPGPLSSEAGEGEDDAGEDDAGEDDAGEDGRFAGEAGIIGRGVRWRADTTPVGLMGSGSFGRPNGAKR
jgi:hypothetical protein